MPEESLFAFFKAAGWHITWISNQDNYAIKSEWMDYADEQIVLNRLAGRSSKSMDDVVLSPLEKALRNKKWKMEAAPPTLYHERGRAARAHDHTAYRLFGA